MIQIPYEGIGLGVSIFLGVWAFIEADTDRGRIFIAATMAVLFLLPKVWQGLAGSIVRLIGWTVFGIGCLIFLKYRGFGIR